MLSWGGPLLSIKDWRKFLEVGVEESELVVLRKHFQSGLPLGSDEFVAGLEALTGRVLHERKRGKKPAQELIGDTIQIRNLIV